MQIVDVRDLVDLHIRAMTSPVAGGERFLGVGEFMWMADISRTLRARLGAVADKVPQRDMPDWIVPIILGIRFVDADDDAPVGEDASTYRRQGATVVALAATSGGDHAGRLCRQLDRQGAL